MRGASAAEVMSTLDHASITVDQPGARHRARRARASRWPRAELVVAANLPIKNGAPDEDGSVQLRGVGDAGLGGAAAR